MTINLDDMVDGYIECMLWTEEEQLRDDSGDLDFYVSAELANKIRVDCDRFIKANKDNLDVAGDYSQAGHDLWLTRNGHGTGFCDRGLGEVGEALGEAARLIGKVWIVAGDDGQVY